MMQVITSPSGLLAAVTVLRDGLKARDGIPVYTRVPAARPKRFVLVEKVGGSRRNLVTDAHAVAVQVWDDDPAQGQLRSEVTARLCLGAMEASIGKRFGDVLVRAFSPTSLPGWFPDPDTGIPRYQFTGELRIRAA